jgi:hypothetical protein
MNAWAKTLLSITLICYFAVSSVAAVHAFPKALSSVSSSGDALSVSLQTEMTQNCHQQQNVDETQGSVSSCKIFCAAMTSAISSKFVSCLPANIHSSEIAFISKGFHTRDLGMEPHPPT